MDRSTIAGAIGLSGLCVAGAIWSFSSGAVFFTHPNSGDEVSSQATQGSFWFGLMLLAMAVCLPMCTITLTRLHRRPTTILSPSGEDSWTGLPTFWIILGLCLIGFVPRAVRLTESLWYDEINALREFAVHGPGPIMGSFFDPANHIAHTLLTWASINLFSTMPLEVGARLPALCFSLAAIPMMFALGRAVSGVRVGIIAALLAALLPVCVLEGADGRGYSMMMFFSAASTFMLVEATRHHGAWRQLVYAGLVALGVWTHFVFVFVAIGHAVCLVAMISRPEDRPVVARGLLAIALAGVLSLTLWAPALPDFLTLFGERSEFDAAKDTPGVFGAEGVHALLQLGGAWAWWAALPGLLLLIAGLIAGLRDNRLRLPLLCGLAGLPIFLVVVSVAGSWMYARFTLFAMPGAILGMAVGVDLLWRWSAAGATGPARLLLWITSRLIDLPILERAVVRFGGPVALILMVVVGTLDLSIRPPRQPLREAVSFAAEYTDPGQPILAVGLFHGVITLYKPSDNPIVMTTHGEGNFEVLLDRVRPRCVVVYYPHLFPLEHRELLAEAAYTQAARFDGWLDWGRGDVVVHRRE